MSVQTINISLPKELIQKIDSAAKSEFASRSDYIRQALVSKLRADKTRDSDWNVLESLSAEIEQRAKEEGYETEDDFVQAVKEIRNSQINLSSRK